VLAPACVARSGEIAAYLDARSLVGFLTAISPPKPAATLGAQHTEFIVCHGGPLCRGP